MSAASATPFAAAVSSASVAGFRKTGRPETPRARSGGSPVRGISTRMARTILVPVNLTESSANALDHALWLAKRLNASIVLLHVLEPPYTGAFVDLVTKHKLREAAGRWAAQKLRDLAESRENWRVPIKYIVRDGVPEYEILRFAERASVSLIVLGRQPRNPLSRLLFGSVSDDVADVSSCPVLVVNDTVSTSQFQPRRSHGTAGSNHHPIESGG